MYGPRDFRQRMNFKKEEIMKCRGQIFSHYSQACDECKDFDKCYKIADVKKRREFYLELEQIKQEKRLAEIRRKRWGYPF